MAKIVFPVSLETEEQLTIPTGAGSACKAVSGYANFFSAFDPDTGGPQVFYQPGSGGIFADFPGILSGDPSNLILGHLDSDTVWVEYQAQITVGPEWRAITDVTPIVNIAGFSFADSDTADDSGAHIDSCTWEKVGVESRRPSFRIRLLVNLRVRGGYGFFVTKLSYHFIAIGRPL